MKRILAVLNLMGAVGIVLLMRALYRLAGGKTFETAEATGVIGGADGPTTIYLSSSRPGPGLVLAVLLLALFICNGVVLWRTNRAPDKEKSND